MGAIRDFLTRRMCTHFMTTNCAETVIDGYLPQENLPFSTATQQKCHPDSHSRFCKELLLATTRQRVVRGENFGLVNEPHSSTGVSAQRREVTAAESVSGISCSADPSSILPGSRRWSSRTDVMVWPRALTDRLLDAPIVISAPAVTLTANSRRARPKYEALFRYLLGKRFLASTELTPIFWRCA